MAPEKRLALLISNPATLNELWSEQPLTPSDIETAKKEGVYPLLCDTITSSLDPATIDNSEWVILYDEMKRSNFQAAAQELDTLPTLVESLSCIEQDSPILLKGIVLSCFFYPETFLRPMQDVDLIIKSDSVCSMNAALTSFGFYHENNTFGGVTMSQFILTKELASGGALALDIHTQVFNGPALFDLLPYETVLEHAIKTKILEQPVLIPCTAHCLVHAIIHLVAHHKNSRKLIWLYDIWLLVESLNTANTQQFLQYAEEKRVAKILFTSLMRCDEYFPFHNHGLIEKIKELSEHQGQDVHPATALLLDSSRNNRFITDWHAMASVGDKLRLLKEHLIPSYSYIQNKYQVQSFPVVIACYFWRIVKGSVRLLLTKS